MHSDPHCESAESNLPRPPTPRMTQAKDVSAIISNDSAPYEMHNNYRFPAVGSLSDPPFSKADDEICGCGESRGSYAYSVTAASEGVGACGGSTVCCADVIEVVTKSGEELRFPLIHSRAGGLRSSLSMSGEGACEQRSSLSTPRNDRKSTTGISPKDDIFGSPHSSCRGSLTSHMQLRSARAYIHESETPSAAVSDASAADLYYKNRVAAASTRVRRTSSKQMTPPCAALFRGQVVEECGQPVADGNLPTCSSLGSFQQWSPSCVNDVNPCMYSPRDRRSSGTSCVAGSTKSVAVSTLQSIGVSTPRMAEYFAEFDTHHEKDTPRFPLFHRADTSDMIPRLRSPPDIHLTQPLVGGRGTSPDSCTSPFFAHQVPSSVPGVDPSCCSGTLPAVLLRERSDGNSCDGGLTTNTLLRELLRKVEQLEVCNKALEKRVKILEAKNSGGPGGDDVLSPSDGACGAHSLCYDEATGDGVEAGFVESPSPSVPRESSLNSRTDTRAPSKFTD